MSITKNSCQVPNCQRDRGKGLIFCDAHWRATPPAHKAAINRNKPGRGLQPTPAYAEAVAAAIKALRAGGVVTSNPKPAAPPAPKPARTAPTFRLTPSGAVPKADVMAWWRSLPDATPVQVRPILASKSGSAIDEDTIRLTGTLDFIGSMLARLKPFLAYETGLTRVSVSLSQLKERGTDKVVPGCYKLYLQVHQRKGGSS